MEIKKFNALKKLISKNLFGNVFMRRVSVLVGGTAIGQIIAMIALPMLTRMYEPEAFSTLAVYISILSMISVVAGLCFEYAIPLPKSDRIGAALCVIALANVSIITALSIFVLLIYYYFLFASINDGVRLVLWLLPIGIFIIGIYNTLQYWSTRRKSFSLIAKTRITQSLSGTGVKVVVGLVFNGSVYGLILGQLIAQGAGFLTLGLSLLRKDLHIFFKIKKKHLSHALHRYIKFPKFTTLEVFSNIGGLQIPVILIASNSNSAEAGYLMVAMQLLSSPLGMLCGAVGQVYLAEAADEKNKAHLAEFTKKTISNLAKWGIIPFSLVALLAPFLVPWLLGHHWQRTGVLISWMVPWFFMQFISSPVSTILYITGNHRAAFFLQVVGLIIRLTCVLIFVYCDKELIGESYSVSGFIFYTIYLLVILKVLRSSCVMQKKIGSDGGLL